MPWLHTPSPSRSASGDVHGAGQPAPKVGFLYRTFVRFFRSFPLSFETCTVCSWENNRTENILECGSSSYRLLRRAHTPAAKGGKQRRRRRLWADGRPPAATGAFLQQVDKLKGGSCCYRTPRRFAPALRDVRLHFVPDGAPPFCSAEHGRDFHYRKAYGSSPGANVKLANVDCELLTALP